MAQASAEKLEQTGPAAKERVATERAVGKSAGAHHSKRARVRGIRARAWRGEGGLDREGRKIPRRTGRASNKGFPRTSRRKGEWTQKLSRTICRVLVSLLVWPNLRWERKLGDEEPAHKKKE